MAGNTSDKILQLEIINKVCKQLCNPTKSIDIKYQRKNKNIVTHDSMRIDLLPQG